MLSNASKNFIGQLNMEKPKCLLNERINLCLFSMFMASLASQPPLVHVLAYILPPRKPQLSENILDRLGNGVAWNRNSHTS